MSLNNLILLTGRTINQGVALEGGKTTKENVRAAAICTFDKEDFKKAKRIYYGMMGWDPETGVPGEAKLHELDIAWVRDVT